MTNPFPPDSEWGRRCMSEEERYGRAYGEGAAAKTIHDLTGKTFTNPYRYATADYRAWKDGYEQGDRP